METCVSARLSFLTLLLAICCVFVVACVPRQRSESSDDYRPAPAEQALSNHARSPRSAPPELLPPTATPAVTGTPSPLPPPDLDREPRLRVLLDRGPRQQITLVQTLRFEGRSLAPGTYTAVAAGGGVQLSGPGLARWDLPVTGGLFTGRDDGERPAFAVAGDRRRFAGNLYLVRDAADVLVCEELSLEAFLYGVLTKEMGDDWPVESLKAQAVAARSYIASQWMRHYRRPWQLAAAERVDLAYAGIVDDPHPRLNTAIDATKGQLLFYRNLPLPAYFHAGSGGRTESAANIWPERKAADGITDPNAAMTSVDDPWSARASKAMGRRDISGWTVRLTPDDFARALEAGAAAELKTLRIGTISSVAIDRRHSDSKRVATVAIRHRVGRSEETLHLDAHDVRMWIGSHRIRSTAWSACSFSKGVLTISGTGFGHGVGLSQVSAWQMAREGLQYDRILRQFYPGATMVDRW
jgi:SpoIID/LytB domain protein